MPSNIDTKKNITSKGNVQKEANQSFLRKILDAISGTDSEGRAKKKMLKSIAKQMSQSKYKFYNYRKDLIQSQFGAFFYEIYRTTQHLANFFDVRTRAESIKSLLFDALLTKHQSDLKNKLEDEYIDKLFAESKNINESINIIKTNLNSFIKSFNSEQIKKINSTYNQIVDISNLINYDWYYLLHKLDSTITEGNFNYKPNFESIEGKYIADDIVTIDDYLETINFTSDWKNISDYLNLVSEDKGMIDIFKKLINMLKSLRRENILVTMIKLITEDPFFKPKLFQSKVHIVQEYINNFQMNVQSKVQLSIRAMQQQRINNMLMAIFQTTIILRMKYYTPKLDEAMKSKGFQNGLKYVDPANYLKAFLLDVCKGDIKTRIDILIIKGTWDTNVHSSEFSDILDKFTKLSDKIIEFDNNCSEDSQYGRELRRLLVTVKRDQKAKQLVAKIVDRIDSSAASLIVEGINLFIKIANMIKLLLDDYSLKNPKLIINSHKIKWDFGSDFKIDMTNIYKKLSNMVVLLKSYVNAQNKSNSAESQSASQGDEDSN